MHWRTVMMGQFLPPPSINEIYLLEVERTSQLSVLHGHQRTISGNGVLARTVGIGDICQRQNRPNSWDLATGTPAAQMPGPAGHCYGLTVSADGKMIACVGGGRVHLYDAENRRPLDMLLSRNARLIIERGILSGLKIACDWIARQRSRDLGHSTEESTLSTEWASVCRRTDGLPARWQHASHVESAIVR